MGLLHPVEVDEMREEVTQACLPEELLVEVERGLEVEVEGADEFLRVVVEMVILSEDETILDFQQSIVTLFLWVFS